MIWQQNLTLYWSISWGGIFPPLSFEKALSRCMLGHESWALILMGPRGFPNITRIWVLVLNGKINAGSPNKDEGKFTVVSRSAETKTCLWLLIH